MQRARPIERAAAAASSISKPAARGYRNSGPQIVARTLSPYAARRQQHFLRSITTVTALGTIASAWQWYAGNNQFVRDVHAEEPPADSSPEIIFEKARKKATSAEQNRAIISSQHLQVKKSWENPGVYAWGNNKGKVVAPDSQETYIKTPRRLPFFDGMILRDIKLDQDFGAAVNENGDLLQWGVGYSKDTSIPTVTLKGKNLTSISFSRDRILGLTRDGSVYSVPVSKAEQESESKVSESSSIPFWSSTTSVGCRKIQIPNLTRSEKVCSIATGLEHALLLTNKGRVFSAAASSSDYPHHGQLGVPGLTITTRPPGPYDQPHEVTGLRGFKIRQVAAGDNHSLALDDQGRLFTFGDNSMGQLGFDYNVDMPAVDNPTLVPVQKLYNGTSQVARVTSIAAGGNNSYFTADATRVASQGELDVLPRGLGRVTADTFAFGQGIWGGLANGRWTHAQSTPSKIPSLSGLFEYDEKKSEVIPIRLSRVSVGSNHAAVVMDNVTYVQAGDRRSSTENDTNWGADIVFFGNNEYYQLGTGKRNNVSTPTYIQPLDMKSEKEYRKEEQHRFQITPKKRVSVNGKTRDVEQRVECGRGVTAVYSGA